MAESLDDEQTPDTPRTDWLRDTLHYPDLIRVIETNDFLKGRARDFFSRIETDDRDVWPDGGGEIMTGFDNHFRVRSGASLVRLKQPPSNVLWSSLISERTYYIQNDATAAATNDHGFEVIYGIVSGSGGNFDFAYALKPVSLTALDTEFQLWRVNRPNYYLRVNGDGTLTRILDTTPWAPATAYRSQVSLQRYHAHNNSSSGVRYEDYVTDFDTRSYLFMWERELDLLRTSNAAEGGVRVNFKCSAEAEVHGSSGHYNIRHHLFAVSLKDDGTEILNDDAITAGEPYKGKGANIGSPCPSLCAMAYFPTHGIPECKY